VYLKAGGPLRGSAPARLLPHWACPPACPSWQRRRRLLPPAAANTAAAARRAQVLARSGRDLAALQAALPQRSERAIKNFYTMNKVALGLDKLMTDAGHTLPARTIWT
jgi:hypothetical protein